MRSRAAGSGWSDVVPAPTVDDLRLWIGGEFPADPVASTTFRLERAHAAAVEAIESRCLAEFVDDTDDAYTDHPEPVVTAILIQGHRLFTRASSPQGVAGFDATGNIFRVVALDPDVKAMLGDYLDLTRFA
jgi:hypothetical protein